MGNSKSTVGEHQPEDDVTTGLTSGRSDAEHNASIIPVAEIVDNVYSTESVLTGGINVGDYNANFIPLHAGREPSNDGIPSYSENNKDGTTKLRDDTQDDKTSEQHATVAVFNEEKKTLAKQGSSSTHRGVNLIGRKKRRIWSGYKSIISHAFQRPVSI
nr:uncharacterized protein LOC120968638 [Aegilops tauschii subsp. strangulata]XP_045085216.1 uncharacterized protein LOC120965328 [Aegilops tauschii subsp. strangulata]